MSKRSRNRPKRRRKRARRRARSAWYIDEADGGRAAAMKRGLSSRRGRAEAGLAGTLRCFRCGALGARRSFPADGGQSFNFCDPCRPAEWKLDYTRNSGRGSKYLGKRP